MDEAELVVRIAGQLSQLDGIFQAQLCAEHAQAVEELDGFLAGHARFPGGLIALKRLQRFVMNVIVTGGDEAFEQRMRFVRLALKFRMKLAGNKEGMIL